MKLPVLLLVLASFGLAQGCATRTSSFDIVSVTPKHVSPSYVLDNPLLWPGVSNAWKTERDLLAFEVVTSEQVDLRPAPPPGGGDWITLFVEDCSGAIRAIFHPGTRFVGRSPSGGFEYEIVIEYKQRGASSDPTYYDLFEAPTELCFHIQTIDMPFVKRGRSYRLQLNGEIRRIAEGS